jgi:hypothetical protein
MQHELIILSSSPGQPLSDDRELASSSKESSTSSSHGRTIDNSSKAPKNPENAETDFRLASDGGHRRAVAGVLPITAEAQNTAVTTNGVAATEAKTTRRKNNGSVSTARAKKREADKTATPEGGRARKNVRKGRATGPVSAYFGPGKEQEGVDSTGSPPPRRRISWTPPKISHSTTFPDEGFVQISEFEYKASQIETSAAKQTAFAFGRKIEVCTV